MGPGVRTRYTAFFLCESLVGVDPVQTSEEGSMYYVSNALSDLVQLAV